MDVTLWEGYWIQFSIKLITEICLDNLNALLLNWCSDGPLPLLRQGFLAPNRINEFIDFRLLRFISCLNLLVFCANFITTSRFCNFSTLRKAISASKWLGSDIDGSAVGISITDPIYIEWLRQVILPHIQNYTGVCQQSPFSSFTKFVVGNPSFLYIGL
jgi:hypothetical protein